MPSDARSVAYDVAQLYLEQARDDLREATANNLPVATDKIKAVLGELEELHGALIACHEPLGTIRTQLDKESRAQGGSV